MSKSVSKSVPKSAKSVVLYEETVPLGWLFLALGGVAWAAMVGFLIFALLSPVGAKDLFSLSVPVLAIVFFTFTLWNFKSLKIKITSRDVELRFGPIFKTIIERRHIISSSVTKANFGRYLSVGSRRGADGSRAYIALFGPAVQLERRNEAPFVFTSRNPEEICALLERPGKKK